MAEKPRRSFWSLLVTCVLGVLLCTGLPGFLYYWYFVDVQTVSEYHKPPPPPEGELTDDRLEDRPAPAFDPDRMDRRPLDGWLVNQSAAVIRLDVAPADPEAEAHLLRLHPSYAAAVIAAGGTRGRVLLPSINLLDGKAKQFDDGLYAALDQAYYRGLDDKLRSHVDLVKRLYQRAGKDSKAAPFLAAGLELAGVHEEPADVQAKKDWLHQFAQNEVSSKPISFYTWNETLKSCFRFLRFFQHQFDEDELAIPLALARVLAQDPGLLGDYRTAVGFYAKLTNPLICLSVADLAGAGPIEADRFLQLCQEKQVFHSAVALFPPSTSRETVLFERLFPDGLPPDADLMRTLIRHIRSGKVDLRPGRESGWYDYQVYALETFLLPEKGEERPKLLLTREYKKRMMEAFKALLTKRRETHARQLGIGCVKGGKPAPGERERPITPRLRVEPNPSYYLRTVRAYAFLANFLEATVGKEGLRSLHGLRADGVRGPDLHAELSFMRDLFYGLYLVSAEDIGLKPALAKDEPVDPERCYHLAADWLPKAFEDPDMAADTRVSVPVYVDPVGGVTRLWATLGVRLAKLDADFARPPHIRLQDGGGWKTAETYQLGPAHYLIPVDEFAEVELTGRKALSRDEFRAVCDREQTKEAIVAALQGGRFARTSPDDSETDWLWTGVAAAGVAVGLVVLYLVVRRLRAGG